MQVASASKHFRQTANSLGRNQRARKKTFIIIMMLSVYNYSRIEACLIFISLLPSNMCLATRFRVSVSVLVSDSVLVHRLPLRPGLLRPYLFHSSLAGNAVSSHYHSSCGSSGLWCPFLWSSLLAGSLRISPSVNLAANLQTGASSSSESRRARCSRSHWP